MSAELRQMLADALTMFERAEVIDFNGHMSCRLPGTPHILINSGSTLFSMVGEPVQPVTMQAAVMGPIRFFPKTASINRKELGEEVARALTAEEVETIGRNLRKPNLMQKVWDYHHARCKLGASFHADRRST